MAAVYYWIHTSGSPNPPVQRTVQVIEPAPICPWRNPEADLQRFFPGATSWQAETRILSGRRLELQQKLGRWPEADENSLRIFRVLRDGNNTGSILTRRVKGEHGAIELLLALGTDSTVRGLDFQRIREPEEIAKALQEPAWVNAFNGQSVTADWRLGHAVPELPAAAVPSGKAIVEGVRSLLILNAMAAGTEAANAHHTSSK